MGANDKLAATFHPGYACTECGTGWNNEASADRCCGNDDLTGYDDPSRHRLSYRLSYD